jgi:hypothetical protein
MIPNEQIKEDIWNDLMQCFCEKNTKNYQYTEIGFYFALFFTVLG